MRLLVFVTAAGVALGGCNRAQRTAEPGAPAAPVAADAQANQTPAALPAAASPLPAAASSLEITLPAGTVLRVLLDTNVGSATSQVEQPVNAHLSRPLVMDGVTVLAAGSRVGGVVTNATRSGRVKGRAHVALRFDSLRPANEETHYTIHTTAVGRTAPSTKKKDALEIAGPAAGGALIGALVGGKKGALVGTAAGGGAGTAIVLSTRGQEVRLPKGSPLTLRLSQPVRIAVKRIHDP